MSRHLIVRVLLSLLLLVSQQMAVSHALSHSMAALSAVSSAESLAEGARQAEASANGDNPDDGDSELARALAQDKNCHQCLAFAHLVGPLSATPRSFAAQDLVGKAVVASVADVRCLRTECPFHSRAPPLA